MIWTEEEATKTRKMQYDPVAFKVFLDFLEDLKDRKVDFIKFGAAIDPLRLIAYQIGFKNIVFTKSETEIVKKPVILAFIIGLLLLLPLVFLLLSPEGQTRPAATFISRDVEIFSKLHPAGEELNLVQKLLDNNPLIMFNFWLKRYFEYWNLNFLFFEGINLTRPGSPDVGLFHLWEIVPFLVGLWCLFFKKDWLLKKNRQLIVFWLLIGPLAASLAFC